MLALIRLMVGLLPAGPTKNRVLGILSPRWTIHPTARIHPSLFWRVRRLDLAEDAFVGLGNVFRDLRSVRLERGAEVGQFNWFTGAALHIAADSTELVATVRLGEQAGITSRHYLDCSGGVTVGRFTTLAGVRSTVLSHSVDVRESVQRLSPVRIGDFCFISTCVTVTSGVTVADRCVVGAGSTVVKDLTVPERLYAGSPAREVGSLEGAKYFTRPQARMKSRSEAARTSRDALRTSRPSS